jgi:hypothetical protein
MFFYLKLQTSQIFLSARRNINNYVVSACAHIGMSLVAKILEEKERKKESLFIDQTAAKK